jgi:hypothetical protein
LKISIVFNEKVHIYSFSEEQSKSSIFFDTPIVTNELIKRIEASLSLLNYVLVLNNNEIFDQKSMLSQTSKHFFIEKNKFIFLNYSVRNQLKKINNQTSILNSFNDFEEILTTELNNILKS